MKICSHCKERKSVSAFNKNAVSADGLHGNCKACRRKTQQRRYYELKGLGLCICGSPLKEGNMSQCAKCIDATKQRYADRQAMCICNCRKPVVKGRSLCKKCNEKNTKANRKVIARRKREGVCVCGKKRQRSRSLCPKCLTSQRERAKVYYQEKKNGRLKR